MNAFDNGLVALSNMMWVFEHIKMMKPGGQSPFIVVFRVVRAGFFVTPHHGAL
jgi:hypothetical protein